MLNKSENPRGQRGLCENERGTTGEKINQISLFFNCTNDDKISQLETELEDLNEALKHDHGSDAWLDAYERYLAVSDELIRLKVGGAR